MEIPSDPRTAALGLARRASTAHDGISAREQEVVALLVRGLKNKEIAQVLSITPITVRHHVSHIFCKLGVESRLELAVFAVRHRLVSISPISDLSRPSPG